MLFLGWVILEGYTLLYMCLFLPDEYSSWLGVKELYGRSFFSPSEGGGFHPWKGWVFVMERSALNLMLGMSLIGWCRS